MSEIKDGGPAFPQPQCSQCGNEHEAHSASDWGMSLRDYFAAQTVAALADTARDERDIEIISIRAYRIADSMLKAREA